MREFEDLRFRAEREVCGIVRVEIRSVGSHRSNRSEIAMNECVGLFEERSGDEKVTRSGDDTRGRHWSLFGDIFSSFDWDEVGSELLVVSSVEGEG